MRRIHLCGTTKPHYQWFTWVGAIPHTAAEMASGSRVPLKQPVWQRHIFFFFFFFEKPPYSGRGQRRILNARDPPRITCIHHEYEMVNNNKCTTITENNDMVHWSFFFGPKEMRSIRKHLPPQLQTCSTFEILTAFLWKCRTIALEFDPNDVVWWGANSSVTVGRWNFPIVPGYLQERGSPMWCLPQRLRCQS